MRRDRKTLPYLLPCAFALAGVLAQPAVAQGTNRWYDEEQVRRGADLFAANCAECHGGDAQGLAEDWRKPGADGNYPPPPLNGTAHAWHHPLPQLRRTLHEGGLRLGGTMPAFGDKLDARQIDAVIAWFQSLWPDPIYAAWQERGGARGITAISPAETETDTALQHLRRQLPQGARIGPPVKTPVPGVLEVPVGNDVLYLLEDGRYALTGDLIDLTRGTNLTEAARAKARRQAIAEQFPPERRIVYPAQGEERTRLVVFTDTTCPFCRRLHREVPQLQAAGVAVHYIPFPRSGTDSEGAVQMRTVWCADDRQRALDRTKGTAAGAVKATADCPAAGAIAAGYRLGQQVGVTGTPAIVLPDGRLVAGYRSAPDLLRLLGINQP